jgi:glutathione S-transferase
MADRLGYGRPPEEDTMIKLYGVPRSRTMRPLWMLEELGVPYENVKVSFVGESREPEFLRLNPNGHIPVLQDGDTVLWESMAINLYLARKYGKDLWPKAVEDEGRAFQWSLWSMTELETPVLTALMHRVIFPKEQRDAKKAAEAAETFKQPLAVLDGALAGRDHLLGKDFTVADLNVASVMSWSSLAGLDMSGARNVAGWLGRCTARPAFARVLKMG